MKKLFLLGTVFLIPVFSQAAGIHVTEGDAVFNNIGISTESLSIAIADLYTVKVATNAAIVAGTNTKITYDAKGLVTSGAQVLLDDIGNPSADKTFTMANKQIKFTYMAPATADGGFEIEATGGFTGDLLHVHQHTGNPGATDLVHLESADVDVIPLRVVGAGVMTADFSGPGVVRFSSNTIMPGTTFYQDGTIVSGEILTQSSATATYLQLSSATATYLQLSSAAATYLQQSSATATYLQTSSAPVTYLQLSSATATYLKASSASLTYVYKTDVIAVAKGGTNLTASADDNVMVGNGTTWETKTLTDCTGAGKGMTYATATNAFNCNSGFLTANQTITVSGDNAGSGTTAITLTAAAAQANIVTLSASSVTVTGNHQIDGWTVEKGSMSITGAGGLGTTYGVTVGSLTLTSAAAPPMVTAGQVNYDSTNETIVYMGATSSHTLSDMQERCMTIETPTDADAFLFFHTNRIIRVTQIDCLVNAATSAVLTFQKCTADGGSCAAVEAAMTCAATNTQSTSIDVPIIASGLWTRIDVGTVTGTVGHVSMCVHFKEEPS